MTLIELQALLAEARTAYHKLQTGQATRVVIDGSDGSRVEFVAAKRSDLYAYIRDLEAQINVLQPTPTFLNNGPAGFVF